MRPSIWSLTRVATCAVVRAAIWLVVRPTAERSRARRCWRSKAPRGHGSSGSQISRGEAIEVFGSPDRQRLHSRELPAGQWSERNLIGGESCDRVRAKGGNGAAAEGHNLIGGETMLAHRLLRAQPASWRAAPPDPSTGHRAGRCRERQPGRSSARQAVPRSGPRSEPSRAGRCCRSTEPRWPGC